MSNRPAPNGPMTNESASRHAPRLHAVADDDERIQAIWSAALLQATSEAVYVVDRDRRITYWNETAEKLTGFSAGEVVGKRCRDGILNHVDEAGTPLCKTRCPLTATMADGQPRKVEVYLHHRDGHRIGVVVSAAAVRGVDGRILGAVEVFHDDSRYHDIAVQLDAAQAASLTDELTQVGNRRMLGRALQRHQSDLRRYGRGFAVLYADVDHFKHVNDEHGHEVGDRVLQLVAATLRDCVRPSDTVGRWGGEEFLVLAPVDTPDQALALAERVRRLVASTWMDTDDGRVRITLSIGVAVAEDKESTTRLIGRADAAMFTAKCDGRDRTCLG